MSLLFRQSVFNDDFENKNFIVLIPRFSFISFIAFLITVLGGCFINNLKMNFYFQQNNFNIVFKPSNTLRLHRESVLPSFVALLKGSCLPPELRDGHLRGAPLTLSTWTVLPELAPRGP